jgi:hypothetical protein
MNVLLVNISISFNNKFLLRLINLYLDEEFSIKVVLNEQILLECVYKSLENTSSFEPKLESDEINFEFINHNCNESGSNIILKSNQITLPFSDGSPNNELNNKLGPFNESNYSSPINPESLTKKLLLLKKE